jgi:two-component system NarL family sensor kinase
MKPEPWLGDAERLIAYLRLSAVPVLILGQAYVTQPEPTPTAFKVALAAFALYAAAVVVLLQVWRAPPWAAEGFAAADIAFAGILAFTSGGGYSQIRFAFVFVPVTTAFRCRPMLTGAVSVASVLVYVGQALSHPSRHSQTGALSFVATQAAYLAWLGAAATLLAYLLARRERAVDQLLTARRRLVAEALAAEERERKRLSEDLHDDAIQNLLAARHELEDTAESDPTGPEARAYGAITTTIANLRAAVSDLHPYLLDQAGIEAALSRAGERSARRGRFALDLDVERRGPGPNDRALVRCAAELLANAATHARARHVEVRLSVEGDDDVLRVADDGVGFDPSSLEQRLREGHVGLLSLQERAEGLGGSLRIDTAPGLGARFTLRLPRSPAVEPVST